MNKLYFGALMRGALLIDGLLLPQQRLFLFALVLCKFSCHRSICRVPIKYFEHLNRCAHIAS